MKKQNLQNTCYFDDPEDLTIEHFNDLEKTANPLNYKNLVGIVDALGPAMPPVVVTPRPYMVTVNLPTKEKYKLNKTISRQWRDYKPSEQYKILSRQTHLLEKITCHQWEIYFEYTKDCNIHTHTIIYSEDHQKDIYIDFVRFFGIKPGNRYAIHITPVTDVNGVRDYLTGKTTKTYQTSPFPCIKKPIDELNK